MEASQKTDQELLQRPPRIDTSTLPKASANRIAQNYGIYVQCLNIDKYIDKYRNGKYMNYYFGQKWKFKQPGQLTVCVVRLGLLVYQKYGHFVTVTEATLSVMGFY